MCSPTNSIRRLSKLKQPWDQPYEVELKVFGKSRPILLNGKPAIPEQTPAVAVIRCRIAPDGSVEMIGK